MVPYLSKLFKAIGDNKEMMKCYGTSGTTEANFGIVEKFINHKTEKKISMVSYLSKLFKAWSDNKKMMKFEYKVNILCLFQSTIYKQGSI